MHEDEQVELINDARKSQTTTPPIDLVNGYETTDKDQGAADALLNSDIAQTEQQNNTYDDSDEEAELSSSSSSSWHVALDRSSLSLSSSATNPLSVSNGYHLNTCLSYLSYISRHLNRYYVVLSLAIIAISCGGTLLRELSSTPPLLKSFWRMFWMSLVLSIGFIIQYQQADLEMIDRFLSLSCLSTIGISALSISAHFGFWIWSLNHTSLAHSLFFVSQYPLVVVCYMIIQRKRLDRLEIIGIIMGLIGSVLLLLDVSETGDLDTDTGGNVSNIPVTVLGDAAAFLGAVAFVIYLYAGKRIRSWLPLFLYTFPMTFLSSIPLLIASLIFEGTTFYGFSTYSVFGFFAPSSLIIMILIAIGPGGIGHTGINYCVSYLSPLSISVVLTLEPVLGVIVGIIAGVESAPQTLTLIGGPIMVVGCLSAVRGTYEREQREKEAQISNTNTTTTIIEQPAPINTSIIVIATTEDVQRDTRDNETN